MLAPAIISTKIQEILPTLMYRQSSCQHITTIHAFQKSLLFPWYIFKKLKNLRSVHREIKANGFNLKRRKRIG
jgi:hypothetical protein